ncbi:hypothetical protein [Bacillus sp. AK128]
MKLILGIIGPKDSTNRIKAVGEKYFSEAFEFIPIEYEVIHELDQLIPDYEKYEIDFWFFSGQAPYSYALLHQLVDSGDSFYPPLAGSSLYRSLIKIILENKVHWESMSFDTLDHEDVEEAFSDAGLQVDLFTLPYEGFKDNEEIYQFHRSLYVTGKVQLCLTCISHVYERLLEERIPVYRVSPTKNVIKRIFPNIINKAKSNAYQRSQVSVIAVEIDSTDWLTLRRKQTFDIRRKEQKLEQYLVDFTERARGSFVRIGDGLYFIFVTWGKLEDLEHSQELQNLSSMILNMTDYHIQIGLGHGYTVNEAELNARKALQYAHEKKEPCIMKVQQDGTVVGPLSTDKSIRFSTRHLSEFIEKRMMELKADTTISLSMISKVYALSQHNKKKEVTAQELASWLQVTDRSARRILRELHTLRLVKEVGEEQPGVRGRPRKIYLFEWDSLQTSSGGII